MATHGQNPWAPEPPPGATSGVLSEATPIVTADGLWWWNGYGWAPTMAALAFQESERQRRRAGWLALGAAVLWLFGLRGRRSTWGRPRLLRLPSTLTAGYREAPKPPPPDGPHSGLSGSLPEHLLGDLPRPLAPAAASLPELS